MFKNNREIIYNSYFYTKGRAWGGGMVSRTELEIEAVEPTDSIIIDIIFKGDILWKVLTLFVQKKLYIYTIWPRYIFISSQDSHSRRYGKLY